VSAKTDPVCLALYALWQPLTGVQVVDGPQVNSDPASKWLFVGHNGDLPDEMSEAAVVEQSLMGFARAKAEDGQVTCAAIAVRGDADVAAARADAYEIVSDAEDLLRADMQLGGLVMHAFVSAHTYMPVQTNTGAKVRVVFTVTYKAQL
jgi:hypothetical protein